MESRYPINQRVIPVLFGLFMLFSIAHADWEKASNGIYEKNHNFWHPSVQMPYAGLAIERQGHVHDVKTFEIRQ
jgi:hypothetical protein